MPTPDFQQLIAQKEYDFLRTEPMLGDNIILLGLSGSYAYGTEREGSDIDIEVKAEKELSCQEKSCGDRQGGGCGNGNGCGLGGALPKVELIGDCRSLVCKKIGFQATKQLEKKHITSFDVECNIDEALSKIASYFNKIDNHQSLRKI